jgi:hypothetical protein
VPPHFSHTRPVGVAHYPYRPAHGTRAPSRTALGLAGLADSPYGAPRLETTSTHFEASATVRAPQRGRIDSDARVWCD